MLIVALVLAVIGLAALVTAVVTSNELIAWVCIAASVIGVVLLIVDALRDRSRAGADEESDAESTDDTDMVETTSDVEDYPDEPPIADYQDDAVPTENESDTVSAEPSSTEGDNEDTARN
ncbi:MULTISPECIES: phage holin family protein [Mycobacteriaceae]|uniref:Phage holin family protein n=1 Tax=Mycolicibacterium parafortuitum TaxID=39692 RepID=A0ACC6MD56_MYCPF|nr:MULTISPECIES: phage holin family protein [Mycobacteriaceae]MBX7452515.1 phage holin family protein [Mycolicibacterium aurantiacum]MDZ5084902.1 phage holin family protein [Mycolicibacterium parafortuitum]GFM18762.1 transmembrane protein [Mycobacterium sp. PO1]GFM25749.1 transmembrane protein [Mycobacterium sp. PO2]